MQARWMTWRALCISRPCCSSGATRYSNCTACSSGSGESGACASGFTLENYYPSLYWPVPGAYAGGMVCRQTCDPLTEYRRYAHDLYCTTKMTAGSSCLSSSTSYYSSTTNPDDTCQSGLCGGPPLTGFGMGGGFCCDAAAAATHCSKGCESVSGACTAKSGVGESCGTSSVGWCRLTLSNP